jgi:hypothetical protein
MKRDPKYQFERLTAKERKMTNKTTYRCEIHTAKTEHIRFLNFIPIKPMLLELSVLDRAIVLKVTRSQYVEKDETWYIEGKEV